jgi:glycosyltransferase involved in cell wall biosynthesis
LDSDPLKILIVGDVVPWCGAVGGTRIVPFQLAQALAEAGHHVDYLAVAPGDSHRNIEPVHALYESLQPGSFVYPNTLVYPLYQYLKRSRALKGYEIVHCEAHLAAFYALHKAALGRPKLAVAEYTPAIPTHFWERRSFFEPYRLLAFKLADLVICPCDYSRANVSQAYGVPLSRTRALHGGVHSSFLSTTPSRKREDKFILLFCGRLNGRRPHKTVDVLLKAMPRVLDKHSAQVNIVGTGRRHDEYLALAQALGIAEAVEFLGFVEHSKMQPHYARAHVFVLPSVRESFPLVLLEAMATGLPVVATAVGGVPEMVVHGETGLLVPPNDPAALGEAINALLDDPPRMKAMGSRGKERVREHFTWDKVAERMAAYFREVRSAPR